MALVGHKHNLGKRQARAQPGLGNNSACGTGVLARVGAKDPARMALPQNRNPLGSLPGFAAG